ncbi:MAG TPA: hypothetical protein PKW46_09790, partial [Thermotogota bacterium]|nr:hypothetical protein [Thermotogota bacterium]
RVNPVFQDTYKSYRAVAKRKGAYAAILALLCALRVNPVFQDTYKRYLAVAKRKGAYAAMTS